MKEKVFLAIVALLIITSVIMIILSIIEALPNNFCLIIALGLTGITNILILISAIKKKKMEE